jgi:hypothetical protein
MRSRAYDFVSFSHFCSMCLLFYGRTELLSIWPS